MNPSHETWAAEGGLVRVVLYPPDGTETLEVEIDTGVPVSDLSAVIARELGLRTDGRQYGLKTRGRTLKPHETLASAGVRDGDELWFLYETAAGAARPESHDAPRPRRERRTDRCR